MSRTASALLAYIERRPRMPVKVTIPMDSRADGDALRRSMEDPTLRAVTIVGGVLLTLPSVAQRRAVISLVLSTICADPEMPRRTPIDELPGMRLGLAHGANSSGE
jgi:hypothetical protein